MAVAWPLTLPQKPEPQGYKDSPGDTTVRSKTATGPPKVRRRATAGVASIKCRYMLDPTQAATLETFYVTDTEGGSLRVSITHPRTDAVVEVLFKNPPVFTPVGDGPYWFADIEWEVMP